MIPVFVNCCDLQPLSTDTVAAVRAGEGHSQSCAAVRLAKSQFAAPDVPSGNCSVDHSLPEDEPLRVFASAAADPDPASSDSPASLLSRVYGPLHRC
jgi:hypothetical protein